MNFCAKVIKEICSKIMQNKVVNLSCYSFKLLFSGLKDIVCESSGADARADAQSYAKLMESSSFIVALVAYSQYFSSTFSINHAMTTRLLFPLPRPN